jgi:hypothetical protein
MRYQHTIFSIIVAVSAIIIVAYLILTHFIWRSSGNSSSQKYIKEYITIVVFGNASVADSVRKYLSYNANIICKGDQQDVQKLLCRKLLGTDKELPIIVFLTNNTLKGVAVGLPSDALWQEITEYISVSQTKFLAISVQEKDLPWHCKLCKNEEDKIVEYLRTLNNEEEILINSIIKANIP